MYRSALTRHCKAAVTAHAAVLKQVCFMWPLESPLRFVLNVFLAGVCAGSACFPGCCCGYMSRTERWSSGSQFLVVQDAVRVSHLQHSTSCPSQWLPFKPVQWINILYTTKGSIFFLNCMVKQCSFCGRYEVDVKCVIWIFACVNYFPWTWCTSIKQI